MRIEYVMNVNNEELYDFLMSNLKKDLNIKSKIVVGTKVKKKGSKNKSYLVEIIKLEKNKEYTIKYTTNLGENIICYKLNKLDDEKVRLDYSEEYNTTSFFKQLNYNLVGIFYSYFFKKRRKKEFKMIEEYIIKKRGEKNDKIS